MRHPGKLRKNYAGVLLINRQVTSFFLGYVMPGHDTEEHGHGSVVTLQLADRILRVYNSLHKSDHTAVVSQKE